MPTTFDPAEAPVPLPRHVRFARALAGLPKIAIGIAAGATLFTAGCGMTCAGTPCGAFGVEPPPYDSGTSGTGGSFHGVAAHDAGSHYADGAASDGAVRDGSATTPDAQDASRGGGPIPAPDLPASWA